jgi:hypothetical protein
MNSYRILEENLGKPSFGRPKRRCDNNINEIPSMRTK